MTTNDNTPETTTGDNCPFCQSEKKNRFAGVARKGTKTSSGPVSLTTIESGSDPDEAADFAGVAEHRPVAVRDPRVLTAQYNIIALGDKCLDSQTTVMHEFFGSKLGTSKLNSMRIADI